MFDSRNTEQKKITFINETIENTKKIDEKAEKIINLLNSTDLHALDPIKPLIYPRRNLSQLIEFYEMYLDSNKEFKANREKLKASGIFEKAGLDPIELEELEKMQILDILEKITKLLDRLNDFNEINIIIKMKKEECAFFDEVMEIVVKSVIHSLKRLPKVIDKLDVYSKFIIRFGKKQEYLTEYPLICKSRLGFVGLENNQNAILQQTKNLTQHLNMIKNLNNEILGTKYARSVNLAVIKIMMLDLKAILIETLDNIEKHKSPNDILFLIKLYSRLRHEEGEFVEEIEDLFCLKPVILKLIFNLFIDFFGCLNSLKEINSEYKAEPLVADLSKILHEFTKNKTIMDIWVSNYGSSFGVKSSKDFAENFSIKCLNRIQELTEQVSISNAGDQAIYLLNNINLFKEYVTMVFGLDVEKQIYKQCEIFLGSIKVCVSNRAPSEASEYILQVLESAKDKVLPEKEKEYIKKGIKKIMDEMLIRKEFIGNTQLLFDAYLQAFGESN